MNHDQYERYLHVDYPRWNREPQIGERIETGLKHRPTMWTLLRIEPYRRKDGTMWMVLHWLSDEGRQATSGRRGRFLKAPRSTAEPRRTVAA